MGWNVPPTSNPAEVSLVGEERWVEGGVGPEGMENNDLNEYLFQHWIQNQAWLVPRAANTVCHGAKPCIEERGPCPVAQGAELVLSLPSTLFVPLPPGRVGPERKEG